MNLDWLKQLDMPYDVLGEHGEIVIVNGDCLKVLAAMPKGCVDAVVSSPPYNQLGSRLPDNPSGMHAETQWITNTKKVGYADDMPEDQYQAWHNNVFSESASVCRAGGSVFVNHKCRWRDTVLLHPARWVSVAGAALRQDIIWRRAGSTTLNARMFAPNDERLLWFVVDGERWKWNQHAASWLSVWSITQDNDPNGHPCPYPLELPRRCIEATTDSQDVVCDPFLGSGTTLVACVRTGRRGIGIEIDPGYYQIAKRRILAELAQPRLPFAEPVKQEQAEMFGDATP